MLTSDLFAPVIYALIGATLFFLGLKLRQFVQPYRHSKRSTRTAAFQVRLIDTPPPPHNRQWLWDNLTPREMEIARLVAEGGRNAEIARELMISIRTVEAHLQHIYEKLDVHSRTELAHVIRDLVD